METYRQITFRFEDSNEVSYIYDCDYGGTGQRSEKTKATPEQIERQNQKNRENKIRREIKANFGPDDYWVTLKYPAGTKKTVPELKKDFRRFRERLTRRYKKIGEDLKYIYRMEIGKQGGLHIHILINRPAGAQADVNIKESWKEGHVWYTTLHEEGGYEKLAAYIAKKPDEQVAGQLSLFPEEDRNELIRYGTSRNLVRPEPEVKTYSRWKVNRILDEITSGDYMKLATEGYYIDKDSIQTGVNPVTGKAYLHYIEYRIKRKNNADRGQPLSCNRYKKPKKNKGHDSGHSGSSIQDRKRRTAKVPASRKTSKR